MLCFGLGEDERGERSNTRVDRLMTMCKRKMEEMNVYADERRVDQGTNIEETLLVDSFLLLLACD